MAFYVVNHTVADFDVFKKIYDQFETTRDKFGVKEHYALQSVEDSNNVTVVGEGELDAIHKFLNSDELKNGMKDAGITGMPDIFIGENVR